MAVRKIYCVQRSEAWKCGVNATPSLYKYKQKFKFNSVVSKISQNLLLETNRCCTQYYIFTNWKIQRNVYPQSLVRFSIFSKVFRWELSLKVFHKVWFSVLNITQSFSAENCLYIAKIRKLSLKVFHEVWFKFSIITQDFSFTNFINFLAKK